MGKRIGTKGNKRVTIHVFGSKRGHWEEESGQVTRVMVEGWGKTAAFRENQQKAWMKTPIWNFLLCTSTFKNRYGYLLNCFPTSIGMTTYFFLHLVCLLNILYWLLSDTQLRVGWCKPLCYWCTNIWPIVRFKLLQCPHMLLSTTCGILVCSVFPPFLLNSSGYFGTRSFRVSQNVMNPFSLLWADIFHNISSTNVC